MRLSAVGHVCASQWSRVLAGRGNDVKQRRRVVADQLAFVHARMYLHMCSTAEPRAWREPSRRLPTPACRVHVPHVQLRRCAGRRASRAGAADRSDGAAPGRVHTAVATPMEPTARAAAAASLATASRLRPAAAAAPATWRAMRTTVRTC